MSQIHCATSSSFRSTIILTPNHISGTCPKLSQHCVLTMLWFWPMIPTTSTRKAFGVKWRNLHYRKLVTSGASAIKWVVHRGWMRKQYLEFLLIHVKIDACEAPNCSNRAWPPYWVRPGTNLASILASVSLSTATISASTSGGGVIIGHTGDLSVAKPTAMPKVKPRQTTSAWTGAQLAQIFSDIDPLW